MAKKDDGPRPSRGKGIEIDLRRVGGRDPIQFKAPRQSRKLASPHGADRARFQRIVRKVPEVMVKISSFASGQNGMSKQARYFTRKGSLTAEAHDGSLLKGMEDMQEMLDDWFGSQHHASASIKRDTMNLILSMPKGTDEKKLMAASRDFSQKAFATHPYYLVQHSDRDHPHVHVTVRMQSMDGKRLNPRKAQLQEWRELFAEALRGQGIEANATRRYERGRVRKAEPQKVRNMRLRGIKPRVMMDRIVDAEKALQNGLPARPIDQYLATRQADVASHYREVAGQLSKSMHSADQVLAVLAEARANEIPREITERQQIIDALKDFAPNVGKGMTIERGDQQDHDPRR